MQYGLAISVTTKVCSGQNIMLQAAFALSFFITRLLIGPAVVYYTLQSSTSPGIVKVRRSTLLGTYMQAAASLLCLQAMFVKHLHCALCPICLCSMLLCRSEVLASRL